MCTKDNAKQRRHRKHKAFIHTELDSIYLFLGVDLCYQTLLRQFHLWPVLVKKQKMMHCFQLQDSEQYKCKELLNKPSAISCFFSCEYLFKRSSAPKATSSFCSKLTGSLDRAFAMSFVILSWTGFHLIPVVVVFSVLCNMFSISSVSFIISCVVCPMKINESYHEIKQSRFSTMPTLWQSGSWFWWGIFSIK